MLLSLSQPVCHWCGLLACSCQYVCLSSLHHSRGFLVIVRDQFHWGADIKFGEVSRNGCVHCCLRVVGWGQRGQRGRFLVDGGGSYRRGGVALL